MMSVEGYHDYTGGCSLHRGDIMNAPGMFSTLGDTKMHAGVIMSTPEEYHEYTGKFRYESENQRSNFEDFCSRTFCDYAVVYVGTSDSLLKFLHQVARAQTLTHFLFHL